MLSEIWYIQLLGDLKATQGSRTLTKFSTEKSALLFAYLAYYCQRAHAREELAERFWPDSEPHAARGNVRVALHGLRRRLEPPGTEAGSVLRADRHRVQMNPDAVRVDIAEFRGTLARAAAAVDVRDRLAALESSKRLHRGEFLAGHTDQWVLDVRTELAELYAGVLRDGSLLLAWAGRGADAIGYAREAVSLDPLNGETRVALMRLLVAAGHPYAAGKEFEALVRVLRDELRVEPSALTLRAVEDLTREAAVRKAIGPAPPLNQPDTGSAIGPGHAAPKAPAGPPVPAPRLPVHLTRFFGREHELAWLGEAAFARGERLITITGQGGSGKTRLAVEFGRSVVADGGATVCFASLADAPSGRPVFASLAVAVLGLDAGREVPAGTGAPPASCGYSAEPEADTELPEADMDVPVVDADLAVKVAEAVGEGPYLLIVDNAEQVAEEAARAVWALLGAAPNLRCVVTSRQRLDVAGEREIRLASLEVPSPYAPPEDMRDFPSVRLFVDRAQSVRPEFGLTSRYAPILAAILAHLEGLPLAIELAASRAGSLTPRQILKQLERRFDLLVSRKHDRSERHQTLWATIDWSVGLLTPAQREMFIALSVFRGGWDLEAAEALAAHVFHGQNAGIPGVSAMDLLDELAARSLLVVEQFGDEARYRMPESLRDYCTEVITTCRGRVSVEAHLQSRHLRPVGTGQPEMAVTEADWEATTVPLAPSLADWHLDYYANTAEALEHGFAGANQLECSARLSQDRENFQASLQHGVTANPVKGLRLACALWPYWVRYGLSGEGYGWFRLLHAAWRAEEEGSGGGPSDGPGKPPESRDFTDRVHPEPMATPMYGATGREATLLAKSLNRAGVLARLQGDYAAAEGLHVEALRIYRELGAKEGEASTLNNLAGLKGTLGMPAEAVPLLKRAVAIYLERGRAPEYETALGSLGVAHMELGEHREAKECFETCLTTYRLRGDAWSVALALYNLAEVARRQGDGLQACAYFRECLQFASACGDLKRCSDALRGLAALAGHATSLDERAKVLLSAQSLLLRSGERLSPPAALSLQRDLDELRRNIGERRFAEALELLASLEPAAVVGLALTCPHSDCPTLATRPGAATASCDL